MWIFVKLICTADLKYSQNHKNLEEIRFGPNQAWNNKCVQALIDIAPDMLRLEDLEISLTHHQDGELFTYQDLGFPKLTSLKIQMSSSRKFEYIAHLLERLQKLTILGPHVELVDHQLITSLKGLPNLTNLVLALKGPYDNKEPILLLSELICILVANHTELSCIDIYCGVGMYKWMSESRFRKVSKLPILQFNLPQEAGRSSLDTLEREGKVVHVRGRVPTGHGRVMEIECRHERRHIAGSSA